MAIELTAEVRKEKNPRKLRRDGFIPAVVYGTKVHHQIQIPEKSLQKALSQATRSSRFTLTLGKEKFDAFLREIQYNPLTDGVIHVDFYQPQPDQPVTMNVLIKLHGTPAGIKQGGTLYQIRQYMPVRGVKDNIPERIEVDVTQMELGTSLRLGDLSLSGVSVMLPLDSTIATVKIPRRLEVAVAAPVAAEGEAAVTAEGEAPAEGAPAAEGAAAAPAKGEKGAPATSKAAAPKAAAPKAAEKGDKQRK